MIISGVTKEQIERAKEWDLLSYLQTFEPQELIKCGSTEYRTATHDSLKISNGKWHWHSRGIGGKSALDYLIKVRGMDFVGAVETLCGERRAVVKKAQTAMHEKEPIKHFSLPEENRYGTAAVSYLQDRGIDAEIISQCIGKELIYESRHYRNCVFVGRDPEGRARYACLRGVDSQLKKEVYGSDKRYSFHLPADSAGSTSVAVAESPIDALSIASILKIQGEDWTVNHYLSLGGTTPRALIQFLHDHPAVTHVSLCLDNDEAGLLGMAKIRGKIQADQTLSGRIKVITDNPPPESCGKDYNEFLQQKRAALRFQKVRTKPDRAAEK